MAELFFLLCDWTLYSCTTIFKHCRPTSVTMSTAIHLLLCIKPLPSVCFNVTKRTEPAYFYLPSTNTGIHTRYKKCNKQSLDCNWSLESTWKPPQLPIQTNNDAHGTSQIFKNDMSTLISKEYKPRGHHVFKAPRIFHPMDKKIHFQLNVKPGMRLFPSLRFLFAWQMIGGRKLTFNEDCFLFSHGSLISN